MYCQDYTTVQAERKKGQHLGAEERGAIKVLGTLTVENKIKSNKWRECCFFCVKH